MSGAERLRRLLPLGLVAAVALFAAATGSASTTDASILNQTVVTDPSGDATSGPDLSGLTVTTWSDGTIQFQVSFANRQYLQPGETAQIFVDLNDDGTADLNLSVWPSFDPSYIARWTGTTWTNIRQLSELTQTPGSFSERVSLSELQGDGAEPIANTIQVAVGTWTADSSGNLSGNADDWIPSATGWVDHSINKPTSTTTTTTTRAATTTTGPRISTGASSRSGSTKVSSPPVTIEPIAPLSAKLGHDVTLRVALKSAAGAIRVFKVCTTLPPTPGVVNLTQCRSDDWGGGIAAVFLISYKMGRVGTTHIKIAASAGSAKTTATAVVHVSKA
jgi:hypothetical protein